MTSLATLQQGWDQAAKEDAFYNILTLPDKTGGRWDVGDFFDHGRAEISEVVARLVRLDLWPERRRRALDFGCGVGRLTQALRNHFDVVYGIDVSLEMVREARRLDPYRRCRFHTNISPDLSEYASGLFDMVYSVITLQHMPPDLQRRYIQDFIRVLSDGGRAVFHVPEGPVFHHPQPWLSMFPTDRDTVTEWVSEVDGRILDVELTTHSGGGYLGWRYTAERVS